MYQKKNQELLTYWNSIRGSRVAPKRVEVSPSAIGHILPQTFVLEINSLESINFRLAGSHLRDIFGKEFRGTNFFEIWPDTEKVILRKYLSQLINEAAIVSIVFKAQSEIGHEGEFEMILLPLVHASNQIDRILGAINPAENYSWLGLTNLKFACIKEVHISIVNQVTLSTGSVNSYPSLRSLTPNQVVQGDNCKLHVIDGGKTNTASTKT